MFSFHRSARRKRERRIRYAGQAPTPAEALESYRTYVGYFGTFTVHDDARPQFLVHHLEGALNPAMGPELQRFYQFTGPVL